MISRFKRSSFIVLDIIIINLAYFISLYFMVSKHISYETFMKYILFLPIMISLYVIPIWVIKFYMSVWENAGIHEVIKGLMACTSGYIFNLLLGKIVALDISINAMTISYILITILILGYRLFFRICRRIIIYGNIFIEDTREKVLIVGAGSCGRLIINEILSNKLDKYKIVGLIDDDPNKVGTYLRGVKVLGKRDRIKEVVKNKEVDLILIAIPSINTKEINEIVEICQRTKRKVKLIPSLGELIGQEIKLNKMRDIDLRDLLGRDEVKLNESGIKEYLTDKVVLVTGGGGSIGSELCRQIASFYPKLLIILDIYENNCYELQQELTRNYSYLNQQVVIASVRDRKRMNYIFEKYTPQVVFHAAAHKHVPLMEDSPGEAIKNNVGGTLNVAELANKYKADRFVLISTDKAVNPTNVMGASKRLCEMIIQAIDKTSETEFVAVRFGNVLGSNGSVIPLFKRQIQEGGPITVTHKEITRYFMLIPEAAQLVLQAGAFAEGGEIFVLDMGKPMKIYELAKKLIRLSGLEPNKDVKIDIVGLRPGEKLYEELLMSEEGLTKTAHEKIFVAQPGDFEFNELKFKVNGLLKIAENEEYRLKNALGSMVKTYNVNGKDNAKEEIAAMKKL